MARAKKKQQAETVSEETVEAEIAQEEILEAGEDIIDSDGAVAEEVVAEEVAAEEEAVDPDAPLPEMTHEDVRLVEAILFATSSAISVSQIAERFPAERKALIPVILEQLQAQFANRGINLVQRDNRWALRTATDLGDRLRLEKEQPKKFTRSAMETMAIVAYHQPVTRAEIENIRGVATSPGALDALMEAGWIKPGKRREVPGRPVTWLSTQAFLDHFGLEKLEDLPGMEELKAAGLLDKRPAVEAMPTADLFEENDKHEHDPQEVTDEDLVGKVTEEGDDVSALEPAASTDDASDDDESEDEDMGDEDSDDEDSDDEESDEDEDEDTDGDEDDEDFDDEEDDSDDYEEEDDEDSEDEDDEDSDDEDFDDEDDEESDEDDEEDDEDDDEDDK
jgi:segregation and condensation protein B